MSTQPYVRRPTTITTNNTSDPMSEHPHHAVERLKALAEHCDKDAADAERESGLGPKVAQLLRQRAADLRLAIAALTAQQTEPDCGDCGAVEGEPCKDDCTAPYAEQVHALTAQQTATAVSRGELADVLRPLILRWTGRDADANALVAADALLSLLSGGEGLARSEAGR